MHLEGSIILGWNVKALVWVLLAVVSAQPASAATMIKRPDWAKQPSVEDIARYYPDRAQRMEVSGRATIDCTVSAKFTLEACSVLSESPAAYGFGDAALYLSRFYRLKPVTLDGVPVAGGQVQVSIEFMPPNL